MLLLCETYMEVLACKLVKDRCHEDWLKLRKILIIIIIIMIIIFHKFKIKIS